MEFGQFKALNGKSEWTTDHSKRVMDYATSICDALNINDIEKDNIRKAALYHDVGKIAIDEGLLNKPFSLTEKEYKKIKVHVITSAEILESKGYCTIAEIVKAHHENVNGSGYPYGLKNDEIPLGSRIIAVADAYDALTSKRPYNHIKSKEEAIKIIKKDSGTKFDPLIVNAFLEVLEKKLIKAATS